MRKDVAHMSFYSVYTYRLNEKCQISDPFLTAVGTDIEELRLFMERVRGIPLLQAPITEIPMGIVHGKFIALVEHMDAALLDEEFEEHINIQHFVMVPYQYLDKRMTGLSKKQRRTLKVPGILLDIVNRDVQSAHSMLESAFSISKEILYLVSSGRHDKIYTNKEANTIYQFSKLMERYANDEDTDVIYDSIRNRNPIFFCHEEEYRRAIRRELECKKMDLEFRSTVESPAFDLP